MQLGIFLPLVPQNPVTEKKKMAVVIIIFCHYPHNNAQFHCPWWGGCIFNETVCHISLVNAYAIPSLSQEIYHGTVPWWFHVSIWWVWSIVYVKHKTNTRTNKQKHHTHIPSKTQTKQTNQNQKAPTANYPSLPPYF